LPQWRRHLNGERHAFSHPHPHDCPRHRTDCVSSVAAFLLRGTYSAAKAWVNSFSAWAHNEYAGQGVRVMALCPGFVKTEFHERLGIDRAGSAPSYLWLEADFLVREALSDFDSGKALSIPSKRYKAITTVTRVVPKPLLQRAQGLGRK